ncbi:hypothetical protein TSAR_002865 [Trichomalopsis sarcophagae]|uniref:Pro-resilin n=1 Tax=Trichomalopsis sarcophagae TaxID=543379 RepID=A0A232FNG5_9HYME|nr:hypothetical protein TSAR_002865 [Trichomalopsis sarcophagae]
MCIGVLALLCLATTGVLGDLPPGTIRRNANTYLPPEPTKGYDYNKPPGPGFPSPSPPGRPTPGFPVGPPARPTPTFPTGPPARPPTGPPARPSPRPPGPGYPTPGRPTPPGPGYPAPGPRPTPGFPDYTGSPSGPGNTHDDGHVHEPGMPFDFNYAVKEDAYGNDYSHNAISDGDVTRGEYRVQLPDGRTQIVRYTADWKHGFSAQVSYEGTPRFPGGGGGAFGGY